MSKMVGKGPEKIVTAIGQELEEQYSQTAANQRTGNPSIFPSSNTYKL